MKKRSKKYEEAFSKIEKGKVYSKEEAVKLVKETSISKFDGSVEVAMRLNLDTKKADQQLRGAIVLPKGTGKNIRVLVIAKGENAEKAKNAGADYVGDVDMIEKIEKENLTNDLIQQDIINGFKNDSHITTNIILIIVGIFFAFCFAFLTISSSIAFILLFNTSSDTEYND